MKRKNQNYYYLGVKKPITSAEDKEKVAYLLVIDSIELKEETTLSNIYMAYTCTYFPPQNIKTINTYTISIDRLFRFYSSYYS